MFGRYTDSFKTSAQLEAWNNAVTLYDSKDYLKSMLSLLVYMRDPEEDNVRWLEKDGGIDFILSQGTQLVRGRITSEGITSQANLAKINQQSVSLMRKLLELNFSLDYCRYGISEEDIIALRFDTDAINSQPSRVYYALRELALNSDKQDEALSKNYNVISIIDNQNTKQYPPNIIESKCNFLFSQIQSELETTKAMNQEKDASAISWHFMNLIYKIDYLTSPNGSTWLALLNIQKAYYAQDGKLLNEKKNILQTGFEEIINQTKESISLDFYDTVDTFSVTKKSNPDDVKNNITEALKNYVTWDNEKQVNTAIAVLEHGLGYSLFNYSLPKVVRDFMKLYYNVAYNNYFLELGISGKYLKDADTFNINSDEVCRKINALVSDGISSFSNIKFNTNNLNYTSKLGFAASYLKELLAMLNTLVKN